MKTKKRRWKWLGILLVLCALGAIALSVVVHSRMQGPFRDYRMNRSFVSDRGEFEVGVSVRDVTPDLSKYDSWVDVDGNSEFEPKKGDTWEDRNGNGDFDFVWLGGFDSNRPAQGVSDPLWARSLAFRSGGKTIVLCSIDSVGLTHERFIEIRKSIDQENLGIDYISFSTTHTHNSPDTMGIWSHHPLFSKFDEAYTADVLRLAGESIVEAVDRLEPVSVSIGSMDLEPAGFVRDSRMPEVYDRKLCAMRFIKPGGEPLATLVSWGNHPEAMGSENPLISSDFVHYLREGVEKGLPAPNPVEGLGGTCVFIQGPVGGLMTPLGLDVPDRNGTLHEEDGVEKTRALGENVALKVIELLKGDEVLRMADNRLGVVAETIFVPVEGTYKYPLMLGLVHPGWFDGKARSEMSVIRLGEVEILNIPGEIYPEIVDGGIESPAGADFPGEPLEVPPLRSQMKGKVNMVFNLANDEIGYIIPRTQWDQKSPYTYDNDDAPYGEVNSIGVEAAIIIHEKSLSLLKQLHQLLEE